MFTFRKELEKKYNDPSVNTNVFLCVYNRDIDNSTFGRGTLGGACSSKLRYHGVIMGYKSSDIIVGRVIFISNSYQCRA